MCQKGKSHFSIDLTSSVINLHSSGIIFVSKDPKLNPALNVKCDVYYIPLSSFMEHNVPKPVSYEVSHFQGASTSPIFSPDGKKAAFISSVTGGYESDKGQIFLIPDLNKGSAVRLLEGGDDKGAWDRSAQVSICETSTIRVSN